MRVLVGSLFLLFGILGLSSGQVIAEEEPIVIAHRGASGYRPEHTLAAYKLAIRQGADYIEPDLVVTRDGHFVARHDVYLSSTTDVASRPEFFDRKRTYGGKTDWFVFDFTLQELKTLRAIQPRPSRGVGYDGQELVPTLEEIVALVEREKLAGNNVGLYIELKRPDIFSGLHAGFEDRFLKELEAIAAAGTPLFFQCFDTDFVSRIADRTDIPTVLLVGGKKDPDTGWIKSDVDIASFLGTVDGVGVNKALVVTKEGKPSGLIKQVHAAGGFVHVWTVRNDHLPKMFDRVEDELTMLYSIGVDGIFTDFPDTAVKVRGGVFK